MELVKSLVVWGKLSSPRGQTPSSFHGEECQSLAILMYVQWGGVCNSGYVAWLVESAFGRDEVPLLPGGHNLFEGACKFKFFISKTFLSWKCLNVHKIRENHQTTFMCLLPNFHNYQHLANLVSWYPQLLSPLCWIILKQILGIILFYLLILQDVFLRVY